jgi:hypothetical protein
MMIFFAGGDLDASDWLIFGFSALVMAIVIGGVAVGLLYLALAFVTKSKKRSLREDGEPQRSNDAANKDLRT